MKGKMLGFIKQNTTYLLNLSSTYLSQLISAITVVVLTPILLTRLGNQAFAQYGMVLNAVFLAGIFDFGLNIGLLKKLIAEKEDQSKLISTVFYFFLVLSIIALPIGYLAFTKYWGTNGIYGFITVILIIQTILILFFDVMLQSVNKIYLGRTIRISKLIAEFIVLLSISSFASVEWLLLTGIILNFLYLIVLYYFAGKEVAFSLQWNLVDIRLLFDHFKYSCWYFVNAVTIVLVFNAQIMMMGWIASAEQVARFLVLSRFFDIIRIGITNFTLILFPTLATIQKEGNWDKLLSMFKKILLRVSLLALLVLVFAAFVVKPFFLIWSKFNDAAMGNFYLLYCVFILLIVIDNVSATFLAALKENKVSVIISFFQGVLGISLGYFLFFKAGVLGIISASIIALLFTNFWFNPYILVKKLKTFNK